ncbi:hypothetical protein CONLIGDRAFT_494166 [Coniochaeta ligniaria NRRL 30616]|uniref:Protein kinase domain-containing protein n=1 Tax=Coniochaeta ligniaria NRRL 30616 TaxID=1408157 RepID=A0A1J7J0Y8_9PEZI|nr:hypothetical protein CONLIGDRAFT_494166 [Coniochaeta ligniaria NRRL 30616]
MANNPNNDAFVQMQKARMDFFNLWRHNNPICQNYDRRARQPVLDALQFPRAGQWPGHVRRTTFPQLYRIVKSSHKGPEEHRRRAQRHATALDGVLKFADLRVGRILGWGGLGIACEVEGTKAHGEPLKVVCKVALHDSEKEAMSIEKGWHILLAGARHIVQRVVLEERHPVPAGSRHRDDRQTQSQPVGDRAEGQNPASLARSQSVGSNGDLLYRRQVMNDVRSFNRRMLRTQLDEREDLLFIEFMRRGDLYNAIGKVSMSGVDFPNQVLWPILDCLFKGVVAMAFPNVWHAEDQDPEHENVPQRTEVLDDSLWEPNQVDGTLVHFDLDPQNILVGDYDDDEHSVLPVVKIADLGLCHDVDILMRTNALDMWGTRKIGKFHIYTPEQFTPEWDYITGAPIAEPDGDKGTAGNYHWWTNMYQVAQVMWQLITLHSIECPPVAEAYTINLPDGTTETRWSYGMLMLDPTYDTIGIDRDLRELIMLCMSHVPSHRPTMKFIDTALKEKLRRLGEQPAEHRELVQQFCEQLWTEAPPPAQQPATLAGVAAAQAAAAPLSFQQGATQANFQAQQYSASDPVEERRRAG